MRLVYFVLGWVILVSCDQNSYPVQKAGKPVTAYLNELQTSGQPEAGGGVEAIRQKVWLAQKAHWPNDCRPDIEHVLNHTELTYELLISALDCYATRSYWHEMLTILEKWEEGHVLNSTLTPYKIKALAQMGESGRAGELLWQYLNREKSTKAYEFGAEVYLGLGDTVRSMYAFQQLVSLNPAHPSLVSTYVPLLVSQGFPQKALNLMDHTKLTDEQLMFKARALYQMGEVSDAHKVLASLSGTEAWSQRVTWYQQQNQYDSAVYYTDQLIQMDSSKEHLHKKAQLLELRGWLNSAYALYQTILEKQPTDSIALDRARIVGRKIAYLRSLKEAEATRPFLEIKPKKSINE
ncbi:tetratricopeptide repeat protein [Marinoscillum furvescens]|uniref:Tetratricopeptide repeat protein n=1 Tax=Marinoscillum furvescens DSM 4134 TaxID=1122208 RepID=A0A3D9KZG2_MARFU|nr:hypothetical protein [Marinoscillum furvescens]RED94420.1 hypothetical protein C7460_121107 [Marinoscillum furvescens DSM 4134]